MRFASFMPGRRRVVLVFLLHTGTYAFYLPGVAPTEYNNGNKVELKVNKMTSSKAQLPYSYYTLPFCQPEVIEKKAENLGEILAGDLIENSAYEIHMLQNKTCEVLCAPRTLTATESLQVKKMIDANYYANWIVDNLPAAVVHRDAIGNVQLHPGFPIGFKNNGKYYLNNHVTLNLKYHSDVERYEGFRIVGFEVIPQSLMQAKREDPQEPFGVVGLCDAHAGAAALNWQVGASQPLMFTYDTYWTESALRWAVRWDVYLKMTTGSDIHWFSLLNSGMVALTLAGVVAMILLRTLRRDIMAYNAVASEAEKSEETGWKLLHGDVFRKPRRAKLLAVSVGAGVQLWGMCMACMVFALLGLLSPANRGGLLQSMMLTFTFMGMLAGYVSARLCKVWQLEEAKTVTIMMALLYPSIVFAVYIVLNLCIWVKEQMVGQGSTGRVPIWTMLTLLLLWFGISVPLVVLGSYYGFRQEATELPTRTHHIPRVMKALAWYQDPSVLALVSSVVPFGAVYTELFFIMTSVWQHRFYYLFGFLAVIMVILIVTCALLAISMVYIQLAAEHHRWWWPSFFYPGASALYIFANAIFYYTYKLEISDWVATILYFGYMLIASLLFALMTGSIGTLASFCFVKTIYSSIKVD